MVQNPIIDVPVVPEADTPPSFPVSEGERISTGAPEQKIPDLGLSVTTTIPITEPSWATMVIEQSNADNNRARADQRYGANPSLIDPRSLAGSTVHGVGTWGYPNEPRGKTGDLNPPGAGYQEQQSGVPYGLELNVGGTPQPGGSITGGVWLDGYQVRDGQVVLIDTKDWNGFVFSDKAFWINTVTSEAKRQVDAVGTLGGAVTIEWQVSTDEAANAIRDALRSDPAFEGKISVINIPKKGP